MNEIDSGYGSTNKPPMADLHKRIELVLLVLTRNLQDKEKIMTQPKRSKNEMAEIVKLIHEAVPGDFVKVLGQGIQSIIDAELSAILGAEPYQRVEDRANYRNGYRVRKEPLSTGLGPVHLRIPKLRNGSYYPSILEQYQRVDRALISIISEAYFAGVSTRKMNHLFVDLGLYRDWETDRKSTRLNSSHSAKSRMPSSA